MKSYKESGVDIEEGNRAVQKIKNIVKSTFNENVLSNIGLFGGFYKIDLSKYSEPVLVSSTDGVGTKVLVACEMGKFDSIGKDIVNHCVNDILTSGAEPLFFLDYIGIGKLKSENIESIISGMAEACRENECSLIGGEMAEMPDVYDYGKFDIVGTIVGIVEKSDIIINKVKRGDILVGLPSNGLHTNGYTLARKVLLKKFKLNQYIDELGSTLGEELLKIHRSYYKVLKEILKRPSLHGISHITGGGILGNTKRIIPEGRELKVKWDEWEWPTIFKLIQSVGGISEEEMRNVFNLGIGMILIYDRNHMDELLGYLKAIGEKALIVGEII